MQERRRAGGPLAGIILMAALAGCGYQGKAEFTLNTEGRERESVSPAQREAIASALERLFGTPDEPRVPDGLPLDLEKLTIAAGPVAGDKRGLRTGLYRQHCAVCHGISGDGAGAQAALLNPYPRDFRPGWFKFTSTAGGAKPVPADIERALLRGIPGTAMPSYITLPDREIDALVEYVRYLSMRGETELYLFRLVVDEDEYLPLDMTMIREDWIEPLGAMWEMAEAMVVEPPERPAVDTPEAWEDSVAHGFELFSSPAAQCTQCHGPRGYGDGEETELYDDWNRPKVGISPQQTRRIARLYQLAPQQIRPRDFREGIFRGGGRPEDLYWRIHVGIKGTPMPAAGPAPGSTGVLSPEDIWDVVHYILSLSQ